jgi:hypothetical protein
MSVRRCQREVSSAEFGEWLALWQLEAQESGTGEPTPEQLSAKIQAAMASVGTKSRAATLERIK